MEKDIVIHGVGSFDARWVRSKTKKDWVEFMQRINPRFDKAEEVWDVANSINQIPNIPVIKEVKGYEPTILNRIEKKKKDHGNDKIAKS